MFSSRGKQILVHSVSWLLFFGLILASSAINRSNSLDELFSPPFLLFYATYLFLFYFNQLLLLPKLYLQKKYLLYVTLMIGLLAGVALLQPFDKIAKSQRESFEAMRARQGDFFENRHGPPHVPFEPGQQPPGQPLRRPQSRRIDIVSIILFIAVWAVSLVLALFRQWRQTERRAAAAEIEKTNAELSFLKAQINPHFLFNTLNNIYSLAVEKSNRAPIAIMKLSNIMRYVTDEAKQDDVPLQDEVACITDYISLQQLRLTEKTMVHFTASGAYEHLQIAPIILMPFVENVFKYGVSTHQPSEITISLHIEKDTLHFFCRNTIIKATEGLERTGIGILNTKARLEHIYPQRHTLLIDTNQETFTVQLTIHL